MNNLYLSKITANQAIGNQIDIPKTIAISFFDVPQDVIDGKKNISINVCHRSNLTKYEQIEIQGATNVRFSTKLNSFLIKNGDSPKENDLLIVEKIGKSYSIGLIKKDTDKYIALDELFDKNEKHMLLTANLGSFSKGTKELMASYSNILTALRTKPFLLLAGISGTGKSRLVKELAFMTCLENTINAETQKPYEAQTDKTTPFNYCLIEVKPNWHDSSELLGYYNALDNKYELTPFIRFVYRAIRYSDMPFFVCLDEMNLAPVEQYFAEYLSVLETRTLTNNGIVSATLLDKTLFNGISVANYKDEDKSLINYLAEHGLKLPNNLYVIGTVNMDDTTHQFSRKVIDRAFTIEMNGGDLTDMFSDKNANALRYRNSADVVPLDAIKGRFVHATEIFHTDSPYLKYENDIKKFVPSYLNAINEKLTKTPFQVNYRVQNELILYLAYLIQQNDFPNDIETLIKESVLAILLEKILPRIQGDDKLLGRGQDKDVFTELSEYVERNLLIIEEQTEDNKKLVSGSDLYHQVIEKLDQMHQRLENSYFANFF